MIEKISLTGFGVQDLCMLSGGEPPLDFARDFGLAAPAPSPLVNTETGPKLDTTYWQYQGWQPS